MPRIDQLWYDLDLRVDRFTQGADRAQTAMGKLSAFILEHPVAAAGTLAAALVVVGAKALEMSAKLEKGVREVDTLLGSTGKYVKGFTKDLLDLYESLPIDNVGDLTKGLYQLISAGVPADKAIQALRVSSQAAIGGVTDVTTAVNGLSSAVNAYSRDGLTYSDAADKFFTAVKDGKTTFAELSQSIGLVAPLAASLHISLGDLLANIVALTSKGMDTAASIASIRQALANVLRPSSEFTQLFGEMYKKFNAVTLQRDGLTKFMTDLANAAKGNQQAITYLFGSVESLNAALSLTADGGAHVNQILSDMQGSAGAAQGAFDEMNTSTLATYQTLKNKLEVEMTELGTRTLPAVNRELTGLVALFDLFNGKLAHTNQDQAVTTINSFANSLERIGKLNVQARTAEVRNLTDALVDLVHFDPTVSGAGQTNRLFDTLGKLNADQLSAYVSGLKIVKSYNDQLSADELANLNANLNAAQVLLHKAQRNAPAATAGGESPAPAGYHWEDGPGGARVLVPDKAGGGGGTPLTPEQMRKAEELRNAQRQFLTDLSTQIAQGTTSLLDDLRTQLSQLDAKAKELHETSAAEYTSRRAQLQQQIDELQQLEPLTKQFDAFTAAIEQSATAMDGSQMDSLGTMDALIAKTRAYVLTLKDGDPMLVKANELLKKEVDYREKIAKDAERAADAGHHELEDRQQLLARVTEMAHRIEDGARGAIQLGQAFGILDDNAASALSSIVQIAANLQGAFKLHDFGSILAVAGGVAQLAGTLLGESPAAAAYREELHKNNEAIQALTRVMGEFGLSITGRDFSAAAGLANDPRLTRWAGYDQSPGYTKGYTKDLNAELMAAGLSMAQLRDIAQQLGIAFAGDVPTLKELKQLGEALAATQLAQFAHTFSGQMEALQAQFNLFDITDPLKQLQSLVKLFSSPEFGAPALQKALAGLDLTTPEGRQKAQAALQALFDAMQAGTLKPSDLGGLTAQDLLAALQQIHDLIGQVNGDTGSTSQFTVDQSITEVTADRLVALATSSDLWLQDISASSRDAANLLSAMLAPDVPAPQTGAAPQDGSVPVRPPAPTTTHDWLAEIAGSCADTVKLLAAMLPGSLPTINAPSLPSSPGAASAVFQPGAVVINVSLGGDTTTSKARQLGADLADEFLAKINAGMGRRARHRSRIKGNINAVS